MSSHCSYNSALVFAYKIPPKLNQLRDDEFGAEIITSGKSIDKVFQHNGFYVFLDVFSLKIFLLLFLQPCCLLTRPFCSVEIMGFIISIVTLLRIKYNTVTGFLKDRRSKSDSNS